MILLISLLINIVHKKNISPELLSRAKLLPAKYFKKEFKNKKKDSINLNNSNPLNQNYFETTNNTVGKDNELKLSLSN